MGSDFIDRAKLEAEAERQATQCPPSERADFIDAFRAGAAAYAALIDAETTKEWGVRYLDRPNSPSGYLMTEANAREYAAEGMGVALVSRRVLHGTWLPAVRDDSEERAANEPS